MPQQGGGSNPSRPASRQGYQMPQQGGDSNTSRPASRQGMPRSQQNSVLIGPDSSVLEAADGSDEWQQHQQACYTEVEVDIELDHEAAMQREFLRAAELLSEEELREFVEDHVNSEMK